MIQRATRIGLELAAAIGAAIVVLGAFLLWRLEQGPINVNFLTPYVEQALNESGLGVRVEVEETVFAWSGLADALDLRARQVRVLGADDRQIAAIPEMGVRFSARGLLAQRIAASRVTLIRPRLLLIRHSDGSFGLALDANETATATEPSRPEIESAALIDSLIQAIRRPPDPMDPATALNRLRIVDAQVTVDDRMLETRWQMRDVELTLSREADGITGRARVALAVAQGLATASGGLDLTAATGELHLYGSLAGFEPRMLAEIVPSLRAATAVSATLGGDFDATLDSGFKVISASLRLSTGAGSFNLPKVFPEPVAFVSTQLDARYHRQSERLIVERFAADLGGPRLAGNAEAVRRGDMVDVRADLTAFNVRAGKLKDYWPLTIGPGGRRWVTQNLTEGIVPVAKAQLKGQTRLGDPVAFKRTSLSGEIEFRDVAVDYFKPLPKVTNAAGSATFADGNFAIQVRSARLRDIDVGPADIALTGLDNDDERIAIAVTTNGPLQTAMTILDYPPLRYPQELGIDPAKVQGRAVARTTFAFPLLSDLKFEQVKLGTVAELSDAGVRQAIGDLDVSEGRLKLALDRAGMTITGNAKLAGVPMSVDWKETFSKKTAERSRIRFKTVASDADRQRLGLAFQPYISGAVAADGLVTVRQNGDITINVEGDLTAATLRAPELAFEKPARTPASGVASFEFRKDRLTRVSDFRVQSPTAAIAGSADFTEGARLSGVKFQQLAFGETNVRGQLRTLSNGGYRIEVEGPSFDLRPLLADKPAGQPSTTNESRPMPLDVSLALDRAIVRDGVVVAALRGGLQNNGQRWTRIQLDGTLADAPVSVRYLPDQGGQSLRVEAADAGAVLRGLQVTDDVIGGALVITGTSAASSIWPITGAITMSEYRLVRAPTIARILNAFGPTGFRALVTGQGITFDRLSAGFTAAPERVILRDGRTAGGSLGLTFGGVIDLASQRIDMEGTIVPIYTFNRVIGAIPLIGDLLTGGEGQGLFAATYKVRGPLEDPAVTVNPLAVLAPGFLRNLFFLDGAAGTSAARQRQTEPLAQGN